MAEISENKESILKRLESIESQFNEDTSQEDRDDLNRIRQMVITGDPKEKQQLMEDVLKNAPQELQGGGMFNPSKILAGPSSERFFFIWLNIFLGDRFD